MFPLPSVKHPGFSITELLPAFIRLTQVTRVVEENRAVSCTPERVGIRVCSYNIDEDGQKGIVRCNGEACGWLGSSTGMASKVDTPFANIHIGYRKNIISYSDNDVDRSDDPYFHGNEIPAR